ATSHLLYSGIPPILILASFPPRRSSDLSSLDLILGLRLPCRLPLHVARSFRSAARERHDVIYHVPLACGGAEAPGNMQWQSTGEAKAKDKVERREIGRASGRERGENEDGGYAGVK